MCPPHPAQVGVGAGVASGSLLCLVKAFFLCGISGCVVHVVMCLSLRLSCPMPGHCCSWCVSWSCGLAARAAHGPVLGCATRESEQGFIFICDACALLPLRFLLRTKGLALCERVRVTDWEKLPEHFTLCSCLLRGGFVLTQQCCDFALYTSTGEPVSHPSLSPCLQSLESEGFGLSGWHFDTFLELRCMDVCLVHLQVGTKWSWSLASIF